MGLTLLLILSILFGWAFTEQKNRRVEQLQVLLDEEKRLRKSEKEAYEFAVRKFRATIEELLRG